MKYLKTFESHTNGMSREELKNLILTDEKYKEEIDKADEWIKQFIDIPDDEKSKRGADYIKRVVGLKSGAEEVLSGEYSKEEFKPKEGGKLFNLNLFQNILVNTTYRIALVNREVHKVINSYIDFENEETPFDEMIDMIIDKGQSEWLIRGYIPQYAIDMNLQTN